MLLIQSDLSKALWYLLFPIVAFTHGPIASSSRFCQATGFFVSFFTEASGKCNESVNVAQLTIIYRLCDPNDSSSCRSLCFPVGQFQW